MPMDLPHNKSTNSLPVLVGITIYIGYLLIVRLIDIDALQLDEAEQLVIAESLAWGYGSQPPLFTWLQRSLFELIGWNTVAISLLRFGLMSLALYGSFLMALRLGLKGNGLWLAMLSLALLPQYSWTAVNDLSHSMLLWAASVFTLLCYHRLVTEWHLKHACYLGICIAAGLLAKHSYLIVLGVLFVHSLMTPLWKNLLAQPLVLLPLLAAIGVAAPHYYWVFEHYPWSMESTLHRAGFNGEQSGTASLLQNILLFFIPLVLILPLLKLKQWRHIPTSIDRSLLAFNLWFIGLSTLALFLLVLVGVTSFRERWLIPFYPLISIVAFAMVDWDKLKKWQLIIATIWCVLLLILSLFLFSIRGLESSITGNLNRFEKSAHSLDRLIPDHATVVADDFHAAGLLKLYSPDRKIILYARTPPADLPRQLNHAEWLVWSQRRKSPSLEQQLQEWQQQFAEVESRCQLGYVQSFKETGETFYVTPLTCNGNQ